MTPRGILLAAATATALMGSPALHAESAQLARRPVRVNRVERNEQHRIHNGIQNGELTRLEVARLKNEQRRIRFQEAKFKSDGKVTLQERRRLLNELHHASRDIYRNKHDGQTR